MSARKGVITKGRFTVSSSTDSFAEDVHLRRGSVVSPFDSAHEEEPTHKRVAPPDYSDKNEVHWVVDAPMHAAPPMSETHTDHKTHSRKESDCDDNRKVPIRLVSALQETLCGRFADMMDLHRSVMIDNIAKDARRDDQLKMLAEENLELVRTVTRLQVEQSHLRDRLFGKD